jgi:selenocysteine-specific elongation factor
VVLHSGAMEVLGELRILEEGRKLAPGAKGWARFVCPTPILILPEDRFVLRSPSPAATIGGGRVVRLRLGALRLRRKGLAAELSEWDAMSMGARILKLAGAAPQGVSWSSVRQTLACATNQIPGEAVQFGDWVATAAGLRTIGAALVADLRQHHHAKPLEVGLSREMLRSRYLVDAPAALLDVVLRLTPAVKVEGECLRLESHRVRLAQDEDAAAKTIEAAFRSAGLAVPSLTEVLAGCGVETQRAQAVLALLLRDGTLRKVTPELVFHRDAVAALKERLATRRGAKMTVNEFKEWTGLSRKYAIPLLEFLDRERVTRRDGEVRIIL